MSLTLSEVASSQGLVSLIRCQSVSWEQDQLSGRKGSDGSYGIADFFRSHPKFSVISEENFNKYIHSS